MSFFSWFFFGQQLFCLLYSVDEQSLPCGILHPYSLAAGLQMLDIPIKDKRESQSFRVMSEFKV